jgi:hypothetical protein
MGDLIKSDLHSRNYEANYRRTLFRAANQAGVVTTVGLALTYTGLCISNPVGSLINVVLAKVGIAFLVAFPAAAAYGIMTGYNAGTNVTHSVAGTPLSAFVGVGASGTALIDTSCVFPTAPVVHTILGSGLTGTITTVPSIPLFTDLEGSVILPPGAYAAIYTSTVSGAASLLASFVWEEVPL